MKKVKGGMKMVPKSILKQMSSRQSLSTQKKRVRFDVSDKPTRLEIYKFLEWPVKTMIDENELTGRALKAYVDKSRPFSKSSWATSHNQTDINDYKTLPIDVILFRLYKLHVMKFNTQYERNTVTTVKRVIAIGLSSNEIPVLEVERTRKNMKRSVSLVDKAAKDIFESDAYGVFVKDLLTKEKDQMQSVWDDVDAETTEIRLTDEKALEEIRSFDFYHFLSWFLMLHTMLNGKNRYSNKLKKIVRTVRTKVAYNIARVQCYFMRLQQLEQMYDIEKDVNACDQSAYLSIENTVDFEKVPMDFHYIKDVKAGSGVFISNDPPIGCECTGRSCSAASKNCKKGHEQPIAYTPNKLIKVPQGEPVFECNKRCACSKECVNRVVQHGRQQPLCIFKTSDGSGWGVRAVNAIAKGEFVCEYVGEVITREETEKRAEQYAADGKTCSYMFSLDFAEMENLYTVDATEFGNVSRFLNHSRDPNLGVYCVWVDCLDLNRPKLCFFALRPIKENEELTFDEVREWPKEEERDKKLVGKRDKKLVEKRVEKQEPEVKRRRSSSANAVPRVAK